MTFECALNVTGTKPATSAKAFIQSYQETSKPKYYQKHSKKIENFFKSKLTQNISQAQLSNSLIKTFDVNFKNDGIYFQSSSKTALKYEFGSGNTPPKRFIEPAFIATANEVSNILITDAIDLYKQYSRL